MSTSSSLPANAKWFTNEPRSRIVVNTNLDTGVDTIDSNLNQTTLREAILYTQKHPGFYDIIFEKSVDGGVAHDSNELQLPYWTIQLKKELPTIARGNIRFNSVGAAQSVTILPHNYTKKTIDDVVEKTYKLAEPKGRHGTGSMVYIGHKNICTVGMDAHPYYKAACNRSGDPIPESTRWIVDYPTVEFNSFNFIKNNALGGDASVNGGGGSATGGAITVFSGDVLIQNSVFQDLVASVGKRGLDEPQKGEDAKSLGWFSSSPAEDGQRGGTGGIWSTGLGSGGAGGAGGSAGSRLSGRTVGGGGGNGGDGTYLSGYGGPGAGGGGAFTAPIGGIKEDGRGIPTVRGRHGKGPALAFGAAISVHGIRDFDSIYLPKELVPNTNARLALSDVAFINNKSFIRHFYDLSLVPRDATIWGDGVYANNRLYNADINKGLAYKHSTVLNGGTLYAEPGVDLYYDNIQIAERLDGDSYSPFLKLSAGISSIDTPDFKADKVNTFALSEENKPFHFAVSAPINEQHVHKPSGWNVIKNRDGVHEVNFIQMEDSSSGLRSIVSDQSALQASLNDLYKKALPDKSNEISDKYDNAVLMSGGNSAFSLVGGLLGANSLLKASQGEFGSLMGFGGPFVKAGLMFGAKIFSANTEYQQATEENNARMKELKERLSENRTIGFEPINVLDQREVVHVKNFKIGEDQILFQNLPKKYGSLTYTAGSSVDGGKQVVHVAFTHNIGKNISRRIAEIEPSEDSVLTLNFLQESLPNYFSQLASKTGNKGEILIGTFAKPYRVNSNQSDQFGPANNIAYVERTKGDSATFSILTNLGDDQIFGSNETELIQTYAGDDQIVPGFGSDTVEGGPGTDLVGFRNMPVAVTALSNGDIKVRNTRVFKTYPSSSQPSSVGPKPISASLSELRDKISIKFSANLSPDLPVSRSFSIFSNNSSFKIQSIAVSGDQLELKLTNSVPEKTDFAITYVDPSASDDQSALQSLSNVDADGFAYAYSSSSKNMHGEIGFFPVALDTTLRDVEVIDLVGDSYVDLSLASEQDSSLEIKGFKVNVGLGSEVIGSPEDDHLSFKFDVNDIHPDLCNVCASSSVDGGGGNDLLVFDLPSGSYYEFLSRNGENGEIAFSVPGLGQTSIKYSNIENIVGLDDVKTRRKFTAVNPVSDQPINIIPFDQELPDEPTRDKNRAIGEPYLVDPNYDYSLEDAVKSGAVEVSVPASHFNRTRGPLTANERITYNIVHINEPIEKWQPGYKIIHSRSYRQPVDYELLSFIDVTFKFKITAKESAADQAKYNAVGDSDGRLTSREAYQLLHSKELASRHTVEIWDYRYDKNPSKPIAIYKPSDRINPPERYGIVDRDVLSDVTYPNKIPYIHEQVFTTAYRRDAEQKAQQAFVEKAEKEQLEQDRLDELGRQKTLLLQSGCLVPENQVVNAFSASNQSVIPFLSGSSHSRLLSSAKPTYQYKNDLDRIFDNPRASSSSLRGFPKGLLIEFAASEDSYFNRKGLSLRKFQKQYDLNVDDSGRFLAGSLSSDFLVAARINSKIVGRNGDDILVGGSYNDVLKGGRGDDLIYGGRGKNCAFGGKGHDVFNLHSSGVLIIKDFDPTEDSLRFSNSMKSELLVFDVDENSVYYDDILIARFSSDSFLVA